MAAPRDSSAVMNAVVALLGSDTQLLGLMPNGVWEDEAPTGSTRFVIVSQVAVDDEPIYLGAIEHHLIQAEARSLSTANGDVRAAALRIDALMDPQAPALPGLVVPGYALVDVQREEPIRKRERDEVDRSILWFRRGARYRVEVSRQWQ